MKTRTRHLAAAALLGATALVLTACSGTGSASDAASDATTDGPVQIVASTDVYGDLAASVGGDLVQVTSIINSPDQDPHEYEATARDQLAVSSAALVIENGGGYDPFIETMLDASGSSAAVVTATVAAGLEDEHDHEHEGEAAADSHEHAEFNEHVWYDIDAVRDVVTVIGDQLSTIDPGDSSTYTANVATLNAQLDALVEREASLKGSLGGRSIAITEPVPLYMTDALGLVNATPEAFSEAVEEGTDVPATTLQDTLALFTGGTVDALIYNEQTESAQTDALLNAADAAGIPAVGVTETLPDDAGGYVGWMSANLDAIDGALSS